MKMFLSFFSLMISSLAFAQYSPRIYPVRCDGNEMVSNYNTIIYKFSFGSECIKALKESRNFSGFFCDGDRLQLPNGQFFHEFSWSSQCSEALGHLRISKTGLFCDDSAMYQIHLGFLIQHGFGDDCKEAIDQAGDHKGLFCREGEMYDSWGRLIRDYSFNSNCVKALGEITF